MANEKRLIDANALKKAIREERWVKDRKIQIALEYIGLIIDEQPTEDAVEVVHGRWERVIPTKSAAKWSSKVSCSVCHRQGYTHHKYCPNCGAKMDGET